MKLTILSLALLVASSSATQTYVPGVVLECIDSEMRKHLIDLSIHALDNAYENKIESLFASWMKDPTGQPKRAQNGTTVAIKAWLDARESMGLFQMKECEHAK